MKPFSIGGKVLLALCVTGCQEASSLDRPELRGQFGIDGSMNVYPMTAKAVDHFGKQHPDVFVALSHSSTPAGLRLFIAGGVQMCNCCRPIGPGELAEAERRGVDFIELPVAQDGIVIAVNEKNNWVDFLTLDELRRLWEPDSTVRLWSDLRNGWPERPIALWGPRMSAGTFDCLTTALYNRTGFCRTDFRIRPQDQDRLQQIATELDGVTFCSHGNYASAASGVKLVAIKDSDDPPVLPSLSTIQSGAYRALLRPYFIYVSKEAAARPEVDAFVNDYLQHAAEYARQVGFVPLAPESYRKIQDRFQRRVTGSLFSGRPVHELSVDAILRAAQVQ